MCISPVLVDLAQCFTVYNHNFLDNLTASACHVDQTAVFEGFEDLDSVFIYMSV